jgi:hypothetical protein
MHARDDRHRQQLEQFQEIDTTDRCLAPAALLDAGTEQGDVGAGREVAQAAAQDDGPAGGLARQLGIAEIPVMVAAGWSKAQKRAYVLADNQLAITGSGWDPELLRLELGELKLGGFDLSLTGFGDLELKDLLAERTEGLTDPDDAPAAPEHPVSQTGDLWLLGAKVTCPKCRKVTPLERAIRK